MLVWVGDCHGYSVKSCFDAGSKSVGTGKESSMDCAVHGSGFQRKNMAKMKVMIPARMHAAVSRMSMNFMVLVKSACRMRGPRSGLGENFAFPHDRFEATQSIISSLAWDAHLPSQFEAGVIRI